MHAEIQVFALLAVTSGAGWLMIESGVLKNLLERRRGHRICPSCGRNAEVCSCSKRSSDSSS